MALVCTDDGASRFLIFLFSRDLVYRLSLVRVNLLFRVTRLVTWALCGDGLYSARTGSASLRPEIESDWKL